MVIGKNGTTRTVFIGKNNVYKIPKINNLKRGVEANRNEAFIGKYANFFQETRVSILGILNIQEKIDTFSHITEEHLNDELLIPTVNESAHYLHIFQEELGKIIEKIPEKFRKEVDHWLSIENIGKNKKGEIKLFDIGVSSGAVKAIIELGENIDRILLEEKRKK